MALRFFSRLPTGGGDFGAPSLAAMAPTLPLASLVIALPPALVLLLATWAGLPPLFAATLAALAATVTTGAMPEDALADAADGLFGGANVERRLEIMKDSRHGTYGVMALGGYLLLKSAAIAALLAVSPVGAVLVVAGTGILARSVSLWLPVGLPPARKDGASAGVGLLPARAFWIGTAGAAVLFAALALGTVGPVALIAAVAAGGVMSVLWAIWCRRLVGGQTGDLIGALHALIEVTVLATLLVFV